uniref:Uncharacterized protein n=1 Tax=Arion vulgaris TaxID=1028688 RepID=A0A0B6ZR89_9EUPU
MTIQALGGRNSRDHEHRRLYEEGHLLNSILHFDTARVQEEQDEIMGLEEEHVKEKHCSLKKYKINNNTQQCF